MCMYSNSKAIYWRCSKFIKYYFHFDSILYYYRQVSNQSVIAVQIFDQKKFKKKDQGFLGVINVQVGDVFDVNIGGDGKYSCL